HAAFADLAHDLEAVVDELFWLERPLQLLQRQPRLLQEATHALFPFDRVADFVEEHSIVAADDVQIAAALVAGERHRGGNERHHLIIAVGEGSHAVSLSLSNSHFRARCHSRCSVRNLRFSASAASSSVSPRENFSSTTLRCCGDTFPSSSSSASMAKACSSGVDFVRMCSGSPSIGSSSAS